MNSVKKRSLILAGALLLCGCESRKTPEEHALEAQRAKLNGCQFVCDATQVVPPTTVNGQATAGIIRLASKREVFFISLKAVRLSSKLTEFHLHSGPAGQNGPVIFIFPTTSLIVDSTGASVDADWEPTASQLADLKAGKVYLDIHTEAHPNGELRAQIPVAPGW